MATAPGSFEGLGGNPNLVPSTSGTTTMSGIGPLTGFGIVASAAMGGGPWQDISNFLGGFGSGLRPDPAGAFGTSLDTALNKRGLGPYRTYGQAGAGERKKVLSEVVRAAFGKWDDSYSQHEYEQMFAQNIERFMPNITVQDAIKNRDYYVLNPEESDAWVTPEEMKKRKGSGKARAWQKNQNLLQQAAMAKGILERNPDIKDLHRKGKAYNPEVQTKGWRTKETVKRTIDNVKKSIEDGTFLPAGWAKPATGLIPDATFTGEDPRLTDEGQYTPPDPTVQDPEPTPEPGLITEPEPTPVETPTGPDFEPQVPQVPQWTDEPLIPPGEEQPVLQGEEPPEVPPEEESPSLPPGLSSLLNLIKPKLEESGLGLSDILPSLGLEFPSLSLGGFVNRSAGGFGLTPVPPPPRTEFPTGVQYGEGIPLGKFEYKDDYVRYPTGYPLL